MALPLNLNVKIDRKLFLLGILNGCIFSLIKCPLLATENIFQKFYSFERKGKQYLFLNFVLSLSSFRVNVPTLFCPGEKGLRRYPRQDQNLTYRCAFRGLTIYNLFNIFILLI